MIGNPVITPGKLRRHRSLPPDLEICSTAVRAFGAFRGMRRKLLAEPLSEPLFSMLNRGHQYIGRVADRRIIALECLFGGPVSAAIIEELAYYGIKTVVGYGFAGALSRNIPIGKVVLGDAAFVSDGTTREYVTTSELLRPDPELLRRYRGQIARTCGEPRAVTVWTTDAIYREYPDRVAKWREAGADVVNMDTSHLYAAAKAVGISTVYACVVSDCVEGPEWDAGFESIRQATRDLQDATVALLAELVLNP